MTNNTMKPTVRVPQPYIRGPRGFFSEVHYPRGHSPCFYSRSERCLGAGFHPSMTYMTGPRARMNLPHYFYDILCTASNLDCEFQKLEDLFSSCKTRKGRLPGGTKRSKYSVDDMGYLNFAANSLLRLTNSLKQELVSHVRSVQGQAYHGIGDTDSVILALETKLFDLLRRLESFKVQLVKEQRFNFNKGFKSAPNIGFQKRTDFHERMRGSPETDPCRATFSECEFCSYCDTFKRMCHCRRRPWRITGEFQNHDNNRYKQKHPKPDVAFDVGRFNAERNLVNSVNRQCQGIQLSYQYSEPWGMQRVNNSFRRSNISQQKCNKGDLAPKNKLKVSSTSSISGVNEKIMLKKLSNDSHERSFHNRQHDLNESRKIIIVPSSNFGNHVKTGKRRNRAGKDGKPGGAFKRFFIAKRKRTSNNKRKRSDRSINHKSNSKQENNWKESKSSIGSDSYTDELVHSNETTDSSRKEKKSSLRRITRRMNNRKSRSRNSKRKSPTLSVSSSKSPSRSLGHFTSTDNDHTQDDDEFQRKTSRVVHKRRKPRRSRTKRRRRRYTRVPSKKRQTFHRRNTSWNVKRHPIGFRVDYSENKPITVKTRSKRRHPTFLVRDSGGLDRKLRYDSIHSPRRTSFTLGNRGSFSVIDEDGEPNPWYYSNSFKQHRRHRVPGVRKTFYDPQIPCVSQVPCVQEMPCVPQTSCIPQVPCVQQSPCIPRSSLYPRIQRLNNNKVTHDLSKYFERIPSFCEDQCYQPCRLASINSPDQLECTLESVCNPPPPPICSSEVCCPEPSVCETCPPICEELVMERPQKTKIKKRIVTIERQPKREHKRKERLVVEQISSSEEETAFRSRSHYKYIYFKPKPGSKFVKFLKKSSERLIEYDTFNPTEEPVVIPSSVPKESKRTSTTELIKIVKAIGTNTLAQNFKSPIVVKTSTQFTNTEKAITRTTGTDSIPQPLRPQMANTATDPLYLSQQNKETNTAPEVTKKPVYLGQKSKHTNTVIVSKANAKTETDKEARPHTANKGVNPEKLNMMDKQTSYIKVKTTERGVSPIQKKTADKGEQFSALVLKPQVKSAFTVTDRVPLAGKVTQTHSEKKLSVDEVETQTDKRRRWPVLLTGEAPSILKIPPKNIPRGIAFDWSDSSSEEAIRVNVPDKLVVERKPKSTTVKPSELSVRLVLERRKEDIYRRCSEGCRKPCCHQVKCGIGKNFIVFEKKRSNTVRIVDKSSCTMINNQIKPNPKPLESPFKSKGVSQPTINTRLLKATPINSYKYTNLKNTSPGRGNIRRRKLNESYGTKLNGGTPSKTTHISRKDLNYKSIYNIKTNQNNHKTDISDDSDSSTVNWKKVADRVRTERDL